MGLGSKQAGTTFVDFLLVTVQDRYDRGPTGESSIRHRLISDESVEDGGYR